MDRESFEYHGCVGRGEEETEERIVPRSSSRLVGYPEVNPSMRSAIRAPSHGVLRRGHGMSVQLRRNPHAPMCRHRRMSDFSTSFQRQGRYHSAKQGLARVYTLQGKRVSSVARAHTALDAKTTQETGAAGVRGIGG